MSWVKAIKSAEIKQGLVRSVEVEGDRVVVCRVSESEVYAVEDTCSHDDGPLGDGTLDGTVIECPRHGARFDVRTGDAVRMPAASPIDSFPARISDDGWIEVNIED